ncbi:MAG: sugar porter family MFS transporter [Sphingobium sp.]|nr:sugar porter family MFS transporter [Sphingobium sp.]
MATSAGAEQARVNMGFIAAIVAVATIGGFMFGYDSGVINGTQDGLNHAFDLSSLGTGLNVGAILIGCAFGAFIAGRLADRIGRRAVMMIAAVLFILSALAAGAAGSSAIFILARIVGGLGVGAASVLAPVYISEVVPAEIRGRLSSIQQVMIITGLTGAFLANYWLAGLAGSSTAPLWAGHPAWRWMFWLQVIPAAIYFVALLIIPESPRFLVLKGHEDQATNVLTRLFGAEAARAKVAEIRDSLAADHHKPKLSDLKVNGKIRPVVWAGIGLAIFQQFVGINIVFYYGSVLWQSVGFSESDALATNVISGLVSIAACIITIFTVDKIGRKPLLLIGSLGMAVTLGLMAWSFSTGEFSATGGLHLTPGIGKVAFISALAYSALFNLSWGPIMWVMLGEMFPNQIRGSGLAVAGFFQWIANFGISVSFPWLSANVGLPVTYGFYALSAFVSFFFVRAMVKETRGIELENMEG